MSYPVLTNLDLNGNQLLNAGLQQLATDPSTPFEGQIWQNTTSDEVKAFLNGVVQVIQSGPITSADITDGTIVDIDINAGAAIAKAKLANLDIVNADVNAAAAIAESKLNLASDAAAATPSRRTIGTGALQALAGNTRLDQVASPTSPVSLNTQRITGLADGVAATDAATLGQMNGLVSGMDYKASVRAATTANGALASAFANGQVIDGVTLATGDRILIKNQTAPAENGIYTVNAAGAPTRATDMDVWTEIPGGIVAIEIGAVNADSVYLSTADQGGTLGTTSITFSKLGPTTATGTVQKFSADITGNGTLTQFTVTHNLNTTDVQISVYDVTADLEILVDKKRPTANTVRIDFAAAVANTKVYRVVVMG